MLLKLYGKLVSMQNQVWDVTGPIVMINEAKLGDALKALAKAGYSGRRIKTHAKTIAPRELGGFYIVV